MYSYTITDNVYIEEKFGGENVDKFSQKVANNYERNLDGFSLANRG